MSQVSDKILLRVYTLMGVMGIFAIIIFVRVIVIQTGGKKEWMADMESKRLRERKVPAARGDILSEDLQVLATSQPFFRLAIDPTLLDTSVKNNFPVQLDSLCKLLEQKFGGPEFDANYFHDKIMGAVKNRLRYLYLVRKAVDFQEYREIQTWPLLRNSKFHGGLIEDRITNTRFYPLDSLARITLGILRDDTMAIKGLEKSFDGHLRGEDGKQMVRMIAHDLEVPEENFGAEEARDGASIVTTLDVDMQDIVETELTAAVRNHGAKFGVAILMEVETGEIKAIANYPENFNYAVAHRNDPGSTFKIASAIAALEDGVVQLTDSFDTGNGVTTFYGDEMKDHDPLGKITFADAIMQSSNIAVAQVINTHYNLNRRQDRYLSHLEDMGLLQKVNYQLEGEPDPLVIRPTDRLWSGNTLPWMAIGYNVQLTPLQITTFYNAIANGGRMMAPMFVKEVRNDADVIQSYQPKVLNRSICSGKTVKIMQELMEGVVDRGTAKGIRTEGLKMAGKTGTTQKVKNSRYTEVYQASFCGYFPADNPKYTCFVLIDEPSGGLYYGSNVAAPVFRNVAQQVTAMDLDLAITFEGNTDDTIRFPVSRKVNRENAQAVYENLSIETATQPESRWVTTRQEGKEVQYTEMNIKSGRMPDVRGMSARDAVFLLESMDKLGLKVHLTGSGKVKTQSVDPGTSLEPGRHIILELK